MSSTYFYGFSDAVLEVVLHEPQAGRVPEALVQDVWLHQRLNTRTFVTVDGTRVEVLHPGRMNTDAGPDFIAARLRMGSTTWSGAVEVHVSSGGWQEHGHDRDPRYDATILHVSLYHDIWTGRLQRSDGTSLPEVVLYPHLETPIRRLIHSFYLRTNERILCAAGWGRVDDGLRRDVVRELARERISAKARRFAKADSDQAIYEAVFRGLGYAKNAASMRALARNVPLAVSRSLRRPADLEALFLGASGLLPGPSDLLEADRATADYVMEMHDRFVRLAHRFDLSPMPRTAWRFFRLRPANFPPLRIAQGAALHRPGALLRARPLERLVEAAESDRPVAALRSLFSAEVSDFWIDHVRLDRKTKPRSPAVGRGRVDALLVNVAVPALIAHAVRSRRDPEAYLRLLEAMPADEDEVTRLFAALGTRPSSAYEAQGLHQLYRTRCSEARCMTCRIGAALLQSPVSSGGTRRT